MKRDRHWIIVLASLLVCGAALADGDHRNKAKRLHQAGDIVAVEQILSYVRQHHPGRVIEVDLEEKGGRYLYEIEVVDSTGEVKEHYFDAKTGKPVKSEIKD